jgi:AcrR family transcriptional regulator
MAVAGKTKKDVLQEFRTTEILDAARVVFSRKGFEGATIDAIALEAGVAKGTVYLYFESKRDLFLAALREGVLALHAEVTAQMRSAATCEAKLYAFIAGRFHYFSCNREFFRIYYTEFSRLIAGAANTQPEFLDLYEQQAALLEAVLADGIGTGQLRPFDVPKTARLIYDLIRAALAQHILHGAGEAPEASIQTLYDFVWKGIGTK